MNYFISKLNENPSNKILLFLIIGIGILLRFWNYLEIPFTYDEFGVVYTTRFTSFDELLTKRIMLDGHPAGISVFSYYWIKLVGLHPWLIKLPFTICGGISIYLTWLIGKKWFNNSVGLISASYVAFLQYFITYSQTARPYISGLFFVLLMVNAWSDLIFSDDKKKYKSYIVYIIASVLCAYNHHFSLLFALIVGITGLFFCRKEMLKHYILAGFLIFLLYIPHLNILISQLGIGGLMWQSPPGNFYFFEYIFYSFQFSFVTLSSVFLVLLFALFFSLNKHFYKQRFFRLSVLWFLLPFVIGFTYSRLVSPVLQYSMLIFSFPFFLFAVFALMKEMKFWYNTLCVSLIALLVIPVLVFDLQHYNISYNSLPVSSYRKMNAELKKFTPDKITAIADCPDYVNYYFIQKGIFPQPITLLDSISSLAAFQTFVSTSKAERLLYMESSYSAKENYQIIRKYFPYLQEHTSHVGGDYYAFSKEGPGKSEEIIFSDSFPIKNEYENSENSAIPHFTLDSLKEYSKSYSLPLNEMAVNTNNIIDIQLKVKRISNHKNLILVASINDKDKSIFWGGGNLKNYIQEKDQWTWLYYSFKLPNVDLKNEDVTFTTYLWNNEKGHFLLTDYQIQVRYGNPVVYSFAVKNLPAFNAGFIQK